MATIALDNLKPQDPLKLQTLPQDTTDYASIINSAVGNPLELDQQVQGQETQVQSSLNTLSNLMQEGAGIGSQQLAMENQAGISQQQKEVQDLTNQLNAIKTQANVIPLQIQQESAGRGRTEAGIAPLQTAELRNNAIQALTVGAQLQAKQGNLALAQSQIDRAVELKYRDIENRTKLAELNYNRNKETLERIDKKRADALGYAIQKQKEKDAENKANELAIQNMIVEATPNAPASVIANARKLAESGASRLAVAQSLGVYGGDYLKNELLREQLKTEKAQRAKIYSDMEANAGVGTISPTQVKTATDLQSATANLKLTEGQSKALAFGQRAVNADKALRERLETYDPTTIFSATGRLLKTDNARAFQRDLSDFITAVLRKESGATITEDEFDRFIPLYSPQGIMTNQQDVVQTNLKRDSAIDALISEAGPASAALAAYKNAGKQTEFVSTGNQAADDYFMRSSSALGNVNSSLSTPNAMTAGYVDNQK